MSPRLMRDEEGYKVIQKLTIRSRSQWIRLLDANCEVLVLYSLPN